MRDFPFWCADVRSSTECVTAFAESHTDEAAGFYCKTCFLLFVSGLVCWNDAVRCLVSMAPVPLLLDVCNYMIYIDVH